MRCCSSLSRCSPVRCGCPTPQPPTASTTLPPNRAHNRSLQTFGIKGDFLGLLPGRQTYVIDVNGKCVMAFNDQLNVEQHVDEALKVGVGMCVCVWLCVCVGVCLCVAVCLRVREMQIAIVCMSLQGSGQGKAGKGRGGEGRGEQGRGVQSGAGAQGEWVLLCSPRPGTVRAGTGTAVLVQGMGKDDIVT